MLSDCFMNGAKKPGKVVRRELDMCRNEDAARKARGMCTVLGWMGRLILVR